MDCFKNMDVDDLAFLPGSSANVSRKSGKRSDYSLLNSPGFMSPRRNSLQDESRFLLCLSNFLNAEEYIFTFPFETITN